MPICEEYRVKAAQLEELATQHKGTDLGKRYFELARQWRVMAERVDRRVRLEELLRRATTTTED